MPTTSIDQVASADPVVASFSIFSLIMQADFIVKMVLLILFVSSLWCWAIVYDKYTKLKNLKKKAERFEESFWSGASLETLYETVGAVPTDPMSAVFAAAMREWQRSTNKGASSLALIQERIERAMNVTITREMERLEKFMSVLASIGSTAPFIGLFGTVWGVMNSFRSIAITGNTSLSVVAPGMAEALFATAMGLVAAIPAVLAYNKISNELNKYAGKLENFSSEFMAIFTRQAERRAA